MGISAAAIILIVGASGIAGQTLIIRELLAGICSNELVLGMLLANWLLCETLGAWYFGRHGAVRGRSRDVCLILEALFCLGLAAGLLIARLYRGWLGLPAGQTPGLSTVFWAQAAAMALPAFCHGGLFSACCSLFCDRERQAADIGRVYAWETCGTLLGGLGLSLLLWKLAPHGFLAAYAVINLNCLACFLLAFSGRSRSRMIACSAGLAAWLCLQTLLPADLLHRRSLSFQFRPDRVIGYAASPYGTIAVTRAGAQRTLFYNGMPVASLDHADVAFSETYAHLSLASHPRPRDVLLVGGSAQGLLEQMLKHPLRRIDVLEIDPALVRTIRRHAGSALARSLADPRVRILARDCRHHLLHSPLRYDLIILGTGDPRDLVSNRLFTGEFFRLAAGRLRQGGICGAFLDSSSTYIDRDSGRMQAAVVAGLQAAFPAVGLIPGDRLICLAFADPKTAIPDSRVIAERMEQRGIAAAAVVPDYLRDRLDPRKRQWFERSLAAFPPAANTDLLPAALFSRLLVWARISSPGLAGLLGRLQRLRGTHLAAGICLLAGAVFAFGRRFPRRAADAGVVSAIAATGFTAMTASLILNIAFQVAYGYLFLAIGALLALFTGGMACGGFIAARALRRPGQKPAARLVRLEAALIAFCGALWLIIPRLVRGGPQALAALAACLCACGLLAGGQFPFAAALFGRDGRQQAQTGGLLYSADLAGGWLAGLASSALLLPVIGLRRSCLLLAALKAASLIVLLAGVRRKKNEKNV